MKLMVGECGLWGWGGKGRMKLMVGEWLVVLEGGFDGLFWWWWRLLGRRKGGVCGNCQLSVTLTRIRLSPHYLSLKVEVMKLVVDNLIKL